MVEVGSKRREVIGIRKSVIKVSKEYTLSDYTSY